MNGFVTSNVSPPRAPQDVDERDNAQQIEGPKTLLQFPKRKRGAPKGNRNRFKTGLYTKEAKALRKQITRWKRETNALLKLAQAATSPPPCGEADKIRAASEASAQSFSGGGTVHESPYPKFAKGKFRPPHKGEVMCRVTNNPS